MCDSCLPQQNRFTTVFCVYIHLVYKMELDPEMWLEDYSSHSRDLRDRGGIVLAIFRGKENYDSSYWSLRTSADSVTDGIPSGYETQDILIQDADDVFNLVIGGIQ